MKNEFEASDIFDAEDFETEGNPNASADDQDESEMDEFDLMIKSGTKEEHRTSNVNAPRYGIALLKDIPLFDATPQFNMGDFNIKHSDPRKGNRVNIAFFPRLKLFPFVTQDITIPHEGKAILLNEEEAGEQEAEEYNVATLDSTLRKSKRNHRRTALSFATMIYERYKSEGFILLESLEGIESYKEARRLLEMVLTAVAVNKAIPRDSRERRGFKLAPPFMPDITTFLEDVETNEFLKAKSADIDEYQILVKLRQELIAGSHVANSYCEKTLSHSEAQIRSKEKKDYDLPDFSRSNPKPPLDLVCMIHLNRQPQEMKALEIAQATGAAFQSARPMPAQPDDSASVARYTAGDVARIASEITSDFEQRFAKQNEEFGKRIDELAKAPAAPDVTDVVTKIDAPAVEDKKLETLPPSGNESAGNTGNAGTHNSSQNSANGKTSANKVK